MDFGLTLVPSNTEESTTRIENERDEFGNPKAHRSDVTGFDRKGATALIAVNGSMPIVLHGIGTPPPPAYPGAPPSLANTPLYTLVIFDWHLVCRVPGKLFREAHIEVTFTAQADRGDAEPRAAQHRANGGLDSFWDPVVVEWAPAGTTWYHKTAHTVATSHAVEVSVQAEAAPFFSCGPKYTWTRSDSGAERIAAIRVMGDKCWGEGQRTQANGVRWDMVENEATRSGVASELRTAVLLRRQPMDSGQFLGVVKITSKVSALHGLKEKWWAAVGVLPEDDPLVFDPKVQDRPGPYGGLRNKLDTFAIQESAQIKTIYKEGAAGIKGGEQEKEKEKQGAEPRQL